MEKFKRYLGLFTAIALLVFAFIPGDRDKGFPRASKLTPLDFTLLTQLTRRQSDGMVFWRFSTDYLNRCPPFQKTEIGPYSPEQQGCSGFSPWDLKLIREREHELKAFEPRIHLLLEEYAGSIGTENKLLWERREENQGLKPVRDKRNTELELQLGLAMAKLLDADRVGLAMAIYFVHALLALVVVLMIRGRQTVGDVIFSPFILFGAGAKAAKGFHDKV
jgi:hypothetical protein